MRGGFGVPVSASMGRVLVVPFFLWVVLSSEPRMLVDFSLHSPKYGWGVGHDGAFMLYCVEGSLLRFCCPAGPRLMVSPLLVVGGVLGGVTSIFCC